MNIDLGLIKTLNPCKNRLTNYEKFYKTKSFTPAQFLGLKNIAHPDKIWVADYADAADRPNQEKKIRTIILKYLNKQ